METIATIYLVQNKRGCWARAHVGAHCNPHPPTPIPRAESALRLRRVGRRWDHAPVVARPVGNPSLADDPIERQLTPFARVTAIVAIIAHHEDRAARHCHRAVLAAWVIAAAGRQHTLEVWL